jgi:hypothetical protein
MPAGRPKGSDTKWNPSVRSQVLADLESGLTLRETAENNEISPSLILLKVSRDKEFAEQYARAMSIRTDHDFETLEDELKVTPPMVSTKFGEYVDAGWVAWKRLQVDTRKWALSKRNPKKYGEKIQNEHSGEVGIKVIALAPGSEPLRERPALKPAFDEKLIEGE